MLLTLMCGLGGLAAPAAAQSAQAPDAPAPTLTPDDQEIEVTWDAPADNGDAITGYEVRYRPVTNPASTWTDHSHSSTGTSATIDGLTNGQSYEVQVRARNSVDWGAWSATASTTPGPRPDAPTLTGTLDNGDKFITLGWRTNPSDSSITGYQYRRKRGTSGAWSVWTNIPGSGASTVRYDFPAPVNFVTYYFQIRAVNLIGPGPASHQLSGQATTQLPAPAVTAVAGNEKVELDWTMPSGIDLERVCPCL